ncbi:integrase family protein [Methyloceanibacter sp.]|uniref:tyrosine-type recombinase/integrase n=1 Tax=Methyloceanibacter sp. TaxID=1965321 RepID=UPI002D38EBCF|nr:integrase family protein [Methyloceanibacter sp.]HZP09748.1 integrase family protein [Methyloceanibacter sp.]
MEQERIERKRLKKPPRGERNTSIMTDLSISRMKPRKKQVLTWDKVQKGLYLLVSPGGTKTFRHQFKLNGKWVTRTLGRFGEVTTDTGENANIAWARNRARQDRALASEGIDPRAQHQPTSRRSYETIVEEFIELYAKPRQRTWAQTKRILLDGTDNRERGGKDTRRSPWLKRSMANITKKDAYDLLEGMIAEGHGPKAKITEAWLKTLWKWAARTDRVPANVMDAVIIDYEKKHRERVYTDAELISIWKAAEALPAVERAFIKLLMLLAPRKSELAGMRAKEIADGVWTTPHERTKSKKKARKKRVYVTPLPPLAQRILKGLIKDDTDLVFPGRGGVPLSPTGPLKKKLVKAGAPADLTYHAFRHTLATWLENNGHDTFDRALVLNHAEAGVTAGYSHGIALERKRELLEKWADHVEAKVKVKGTALLR